MPLVGASGAHRGEIFTCDGYIWPDRSKTGILGSGHFDVC